MIFFVKKLLKFALRAEKMAASALRADSTLSPTLSLASLDYLHYFTLLALLALLAYLVSIVSLALLALLDLLDIRKA